MDLPPRPRLCQRLSMRISESIPLRLRSRLPHYRGFRRALWLAALAFAWAPTPSRAAQVWDPRGVAVCGDSCFGDLQRGIPDDEGGVFIVWREIRNSLTSDTDIYAQRITAQGTVAPGWPASGLPVCRALQDQPPESMSSDGEGGFLVSWYDLRTNGEIDLYAHRVLRDGALAPGWPLDGVPVCTARNFQGVSSIAPDGTGGAYVAWEDDRDRLPTQGQNLYLQHLTATGAVWPGWPVNGLSVGPISGNQVRPALMPDGTGGVVVTWTNVTFGVPDIYAQRILADGSVAPGWPALGLLVLLEQRRSQIVPDHAGGFYIAAGRSDSESMAGWRAAASAPEVRLGFDESFHAQRLTFGGALAPGWPVGGLVVCQPLPGSRVGLEAVEDGEGGLYLTWYDYRDPGGEILAARVTPQGALAPGWTVDGTYLSERLTPAAEYAPVIAPDGRGGAYVVWEIARSWVPEVVSQIQHLAGDGTVAPGWPMGGSRVAPSQYMDDPIVVPDSAGGAIVIWGEFGLYAQRFAADGVVGVRLALTSAEATAERVRLAWHGAGASALEAQVERRGEATDWRALGLAEATGADALTFEDRDIVAGERYAYRLSYREDRALRHTAEHWLDVPMAAALALAGFAPNPSPGAARIAFTLPDDSPVTLEVHDIAGRLVMRRDVGALGAGRHVMPLDRTASLDAGVYIIRLRSAASQRTVRGVVTE